MRKDEAPEDRDKVTLKLSAWLECPVCATEIDHLFDAGPGVYDAEDLIDQPEEDVTCPQCGHTWLATYEGWSSHGDAG